MESLVQVFLSTYPEDNRTNLGSYVGGGAVQDLVDFASRSSTDLSQEIAANSAPPLSFFKLTVRDIATKAVTVFGNCTDATTKLSEFSSKFPENQREAIEFTVQDMIDRGIIPSIYSLRDSQENVEGYFESYFATFPTEGGTGNYKLCAHPLVIANAETALSTAQSVVSAHSYSFQLSVKASLDSSSSAYTNSYDLSKTDVQVFNAGSEDEIANGILDAQGVLTFDYPILKDGQNPLPTTVNLDVDFYYGEILLGSIDNGSFSLVDSSSTTYFAADLAIPNSVNNVPIVGDTTVSTSALATDTLIGVTISTAVQNLLNNPSDPMNPIVSLGDIRRIGGLRNTILSEIPSPTTEDLKSIEFLDAHARLEVLTLVAPIGDTKSYYISEGLRQSGFTSAIEIAQAPLGEVVKAGSYFYPEEDEEETPVWTGAGELQIANIYNMARAQSALVTNFLTGYLTQGQVEMENSGPLPSDFFSAFSTLPTFYPNEFIQKLEERCACTDCETAVSPQAYLMEMVNFIQSSIRTKEGTTVAATNLSYLTSKLLQPFDSLAGACAVVDELICNQRIVVEILQKYISLPATSTNIDVALLAHGKRVQTEFLEAIGTSYREAMSMRNQSAEKVKQYANRLGLFYDDSISNFHQDFFNALVPTFSDPSLVEAQLEVCYGYRSTSEYTLSSGLLSFGAMSATEFCNKWRLEGIIYGKHTDLWGKTELGFAHRISPDNYTEVYINRPDMPGLELLAFGRIESSDGTIKVSSADDKFYEISGYFDVTFSALDEGDYDCEIQLICKIQALRYKFLAANLVEKDFPAALADADYLVDAVAIDPDIVSPIDMYYPYNDNNRVHFIWEARKIELDSMSSLMEGLISSSSTPTQLDIDTSAFSVVTGLAADNTGNIFFLGALIGTGIYISKLGIDGNAEISYSTPEELTVNILDPYVFTDEYASLTFDKGSNQLLLGSKNWSGYAFSLALGFSIEHDTISNEYSLDSVPKSV